MYPDVTVGEMATDDLAQVMALLNEQYRGSHEFVEFTLENFTSYVRSEEAKVYVLRAASLQGVATLSESGRGNKIDFFTVKSGPLSRRYGDILVQAIEGALSVKRLYTLLEEGDATIDDWNRRGYFEDDGWLQMIAPLERDAPVPSVKCSANLRTMRDADLASIVALVNSSFGFERLSAECLDEWRRENPDFGMDWVFVAECGGTLASMLVSKPDTEYNRYLGGKRGYLGPAATLPGYRGKGLASALTVMAMNALRRRGMNSVNLYTSVNNASSLRLLKRLGFVRVCKYVQLSKSFEK